MCNFGTSVTERKYEMVNMNIGLNILAFLVKDMGAWGAFKTHWTLDKHLPNM